MQYFLWIWMLWTLPFIGMSQTVGNGAGVEEKGPTTSGFLNASLVEDRLYVDLPESSFEKPMLFTRIGRLNRYETKQVVFRKSGSRIFLEEPRIWSETGIWLPVNGDPKLERNVLGVFPIEQEHANGFRFDITDLLFDGSVGWKWLSDAPKVAGLTRVVATKRLHDEVMIKLHIGQKKEGVKIVQPVHFSFMRLSEPMAPRRFDYRMGFWIESMDTGRNRLKNDLGSIARWRLEKKYPEREISVPIRSIVFTLSPEIPKKWRPYIKAGIEEWLPAFESAGFKDAIVVQEVDTLDDWSNYSLGHSIIRWFRNGNVRHFGKKPSGSTVTYVVDQRSGEIIKSDVLLGSSYEHLMDEYFIRCAALDQRAQTYPFPDELLGELIQSLVAHETGHALGIKDNSYGEYQYPVEKMGSAVWLRSMGHTPSIMNYARHNNLAQPEDSVPPSLLLQKVGPTDKYYIRWGYQEFPKTMSAEQRADSLERIIRLQDTIPWYRYTNDQGDFIGPSVTNEVVETKNPVQGARLALKNLERALLMLPKVNQKEKDNIRTERIYTRALELWYFIMRNVFSLVGGYEVFYKSMEQPGSMYDPIPLGMQQEAMDFILAQAFEPPRWLASPEFIVHSKFMTYPDQLFTYQQLLLQEMLKPRFMKRLQHMETIKGYEGVTKHYLVTLQNGLFPELNGTKGRVDMGKQGLQTAYIDWMVNAVGQEPKGVDPKLTLFVQTDYTKGIMMGRLMELKKQLEKKLLKGTYLEQKGHWALCLSKLEKAFDDLGVEGS